MYSRQSALQLHLAFIIPLSGKQPFLPLTLLPDTLIFSLPVDPLCYLLCFEPVVLFFLGGQLLYLQHSAELVATSAYGEARTCIHMPCRSMLACRLASATKAAYIVKLPEYGSQIDCNWAYAADVSNICKAKIASAGCTTIVHKLCSQATLPASLMALSRASFHVPSYRQRSVAHKQYNVPANGSCASLAWLQLQLAFPLLCGVQQRTPPAEAGCPVIPHHARACPCHSCNQLRSSLQDIGGA